MQPPHTEVHPSTRWYEATSHCIDICDCPAEGIAQELLPAIQERPVLRDKSFSFAMQEVSHHIMYMEPTLVLQLLACLLHRVFLRCDECDP